MPAKAAQELELVTMTGAKEILGIKSRWPVDRMVREGTLLVYKKTGSPRFYYDAEALRDLARPVRVEVRR